ncbi:hypothetical protein [Amycolatopsis sp. CA-230715]|uniref:hypothetical protein n=1 Tax=Amycolatopsis sp. CA-230715 TaxID=2745196 RepID=UPI001C02E721|nr:hypothetical protein [Amycolatopsis sp. CA-230715]QWF76919.1 hypothetical protein HUW46_00299 [Amycolatopsis sp. CA-230715]
MRTLLRSALITGAAALAMLGIGATASASETTAAAPASAEAVASPQSWLIMGNWTLLGDCQAAGYQGLLSGQWTNFTCDNRYYPGWFTLVVYVP